MKKGVNVLTINQIYKFIIQKDTGLYVEQIELMINKLKKLKEQQQNISYLSIDL